MAELVNQRIEETINELEQMRRTNLYEEEEIKEISRKRKEFEYHIQRRIKQKDDYAQYIAYELTLLEDISSRRKQAKLTEKKKDIEYTISRRVNRLFKQFIYRFQNDIQIYFEYIKFCRSVGFDYAISAIIGQMLLIHGDKPNMWLMASKWESEEQDHLENARSFLLKGIQRHPESEILYLELFKIELIELTLKAESEEDKEKQLKRADIVWKNGIQSIESETFLFQLYDLCTKHQVEGLIKNGIQEEIWSRRNNKNIWSFIALKELEGDHWKEADEFLDDDSNFPKEISNFIAVYEEALQQFPDHKLCTKYIHTLLGLSDSVCSDQQKINAIKHAWMYGHESGLLTNEMYAFGIEVLKLDSMSNEELLQILDSAIKKNSQLLCIWEEKLLLNKPDEKKMLSVLEQAVKSLKPDGSLHLYNVMLDHAESNVTLKTLYKKFQNCENAILLAVKPKLLQKIYDHNGIKAARELYEEMIRTPPTQIGVNNTMIGIEKAQEKPNLKNIRKCYECAVLHHGTDNVQVWMDYMKFEIECGNASATPAIYRRAVGCLRKEIVDDFIKAQTLSKLD